MHEAAVIDVGSNSVRLVAYRLDGRALPVGPVTAALADAFEALLLRS